MSGETVSQTNLLLLSDYLSMLGPSFLAVNNMLDTSNLRIYLGSQCEGSPQQQQRGAGQVPHPVRKQKEMNLPFSSFAFRFSPGTHSKESAAHTGDGSPHFCTLIWIGPHSTLKDSSPR